MGAIVAAAGAGLAPAPRGGRTGGLAVGPAGPLTLQAAAKDLETAVEALGKIGPEAVPPLVKAIETDFAHFGGNLANPEAVLRRDARVVAIEAILKIKQNSGMKIGGGALLLMAKLKNDPYPEVKAVATKAYLELQK